MGGGPVWISVSSMGAQQMAFSDLSVTDHFNGQGQFAVVGKIAFDKSHSFILGDGVRVCNKGG